MFNMQISCTKTPRTTLLYLGLKLHWRSLVVVLCSTFILTQLFLLNSRNGRVSHGYRLVQRNISGITRLSGHFNNQTVLSNVGNGSQKLTAPKKSVVNVTNLSHESPSPKLSPVNNSTSNSYTSRGIIKAYHASATRFRHRFNCSAIINGSEPDIQRVRDFLKEDRPEGGYKMSNPGVMSYMFQDCPSYKKIRGYVLDDVPQDEKDFPIAYVILAHQDFDHLERLLRTLYRPQHVFCIHLDGKVVGDLRKAVHGLASCFPNVRMASQPQNITYASMSRLWGDYVCMRDLVNDDKPWRYLINVAATSLPIQTNKQIVRGLSRLKGKNDITMRYAGRIPNRWAVEYHIGRHGHIWPSKIRHVQPPHNITVIKGMAYNTYSRKFLKWVMTDQRAIDFLEWSKMTYSPDEHYWATLNNMYHNPHLNAPGGNYEHPDRHRDATFIAKFNRNNAKCTGLSKHRVCLLESGELTFLKKHAWYRTANKFDLTYDPVAYTCMEESLEDRRETGASL